ncbi:hypothetical protein DOY81_007974 [Sarcophaga bullata]|nr:hypothetical protein DOY81_007974 [Sarcophaga bullata]
MKLNEVKKKTNTSGSSQDLCNLFIKRAAKFLVHICIFKKDDGDTVDGMETLQLTCLMICILQLGIRLVPAGTAKQFSLFSTERLSEQRWAITNPAIAIAIQTATITITTTISLTSKSFHFKEPEWNLIIESTVNFSETAVMLYLDFFSEAKKLPNDDDEFHINSGIWEIRIELIYTQFHNLAYGPPTQ